MLAKALKEAREAKRKNNPDEVQENLLATLLKELKSESEKEKAARTANLTMLAKALQKA